MERVSMIVPTIAAYLFLFFILIYCCVKLEVMEVMLNLFQHLTHKEQIPKQVRNDVPSFST